jgi:hypothetical protein
MLDTDTKQNAHFLWFLRKLLISLTRQHERTQVAQTEPKKTQESTAFM